MEIVKRRYLAGKDGDRKIFREISLVKCKDGSLVPLKKIAAEGGELVQQRADAPAPPAAAVASIKQAPPPAPPAPKLQDTDPDTFSAGIWHQNPDIRRTFANVHQFQAFIRDQMDRRTGKVPHTGRDIIPATVSLAARDTDGVDPTLPLEYQVQLAWLRSADIRAEFRGDFRAYMAYRQAAVASGEGR